MTLNKKKSDLKLQHKKIKYDMMWTLFLKY